MRRDGLLRMVVGPEITFRHGAWLCVLAGLGLSLLGIYAIDVSLYDAPAGGLPLTAGGLAGKQLVYLLVGLLAAGVVAAPHPRLVRALAWPAMLGCVGLLVFLLIPGIPASIVRQRNGARGWIDLGFMDFQPSELAKIAFVLVMAEYLRFRQNHRTFAGLVPPAVIAFVPAALITLQPDLGSAMLFAPATFAMLLCAGARMKHLALVVIVALAAAPLSYRFLAPHQKARIEGMVSLWRDPGAHVQGINFQSVRSQTLAGAGGLAGVPEAKARALHKYNDLPERWNDMILSVVMTRFGLLGGLAVVGLYGLWFLGAMVTAVRSADAFGQLVVVGFGAMMFAQAFVNMGMVLGVLPIIGVTLPFVSNGGTSLLSVWVMTGMIVSVAMRPPERLARPTFEFDDRPASYGDPPPQPKIAPSPRRRSA